MPKKKRKKKKRMDLFKKKKRSIKVRDSSQYFIILNMVVAHIP